MRQTNMRVHLTVVTAPQEVRMTLEEQLKISLSGLGGIDKIFEFIDLIVCKEGERISRMKQYRSLGDQITLPVSLYVIAQNACDSKNKLAPLECQNILKIVIYILNINKTLQEVFQLGHFPWPPTCRGGGFVR